MDLEVKAKETLQELLNVVSACRQQSVKSEQEASRLRVQCEAWRTKVLELEQRNARLRRMLATRSSNSAREPSLCLSVRQSKEPSATVCQFGSLLALAVALSGPGAGNNANASGATGTSLAQNNTSDSCAAATAAAAAGAVAIVAMWPGNRGASLGSATSTGQRAPELSAARSFGGRGSGGGGDESAVAHDDGIRARSSSSLSNMATGGASSSSRAHGRAGFKLVVRGGNGDAASLRQLSTYGAMFPSTASGGSGGPPQVHESYSMGDLTLGGRSSDGLGRLPGRGSALAKTPLGFRTHSASSAGLAEQSSRASSPAELNLEAEAPAAAASFQAEVTGAGRAASPVPYLKQEAPGAQHTQLGEPKQWDKQQELAGLLQPGPQEQQHGGLEQEAHPEQLLREQAQVSSSSAGTEQRDEQGQVPNQAIHPMQQFVRAGEDDGILTSVSEPGPGLAVPNAEPPDSSYREAQPFRRRSDPLDIPSAGSQQSQSDFSQPLPDTDRDIQLQQAQQQQHHHRHDHHHHHHHPVRRRHTHAHHHHHHHTHGHPEALEPAGPAQDSSGPHSAPNRGPLSASHTGASLPPAGPVGRTQSVCVARLHPSAPAATAPVGLAVARRESLPVHLLHKGNLAPLGSGGAGAAGSSGGTVSLPQYSDDMSWHAGSLQKQLSKLQDDLNSIQQSSALIRSNRATCNLAPCSPRPQSLTSSPAMGSVIRRETVGAYPYAQPASPFGGSAAAAAAAAAGAAPGAERGVVSGRLARSGGSDSGNVTEGGRSAGGAVPRPIPRTMSGPALDTAAAAAESVAAAVPASEEEERLKAPAITASASPTDVAAAPSATPSPPEAVPTPPTDVVVTPPDTTGPTRSSSPSCQTCQAVSPEPAFVALYWVTPPAAALVVAKPSPSVRPALLRVLQWLRDRGVATYVEPSMLRGELGLECRMRGKGTQAAASDAGDVTAAPAEDGCGGALGTVVESDSSELSEDSEAPMPGCFTDVPQLLSWPHEEDEGDCLVPPEVAAAVDFVVVLGGDGTVLWTCHIFGNQSVPPVVPFNLGSLGFLTPFDQGSVESVLDHVMEGGFPIMLRHRLHCHIVRSGSSCPAVCGGAPAPACDLRHHHAESTASLTEDAAGGPAAEPSCSREWVVLNEVVIDRGISSFLTNLECYCDGSFVTHVQGDGLIVATPTGSTAYNLAAGGSMVHPQVPGILFTPICPHSLSFRPLIFPDHVSLCVQVPANSRAQMWCSFDGKDRQALNAGDAVVIRMSAWPVPTVCSKDASRDWFSGVREGLHWNMRRIQAGAGQ